MKDYYSEEFWGQFFPCTPHKNVLQYVLGSGFFPLRISTFTNPCLTFSYIKQFRIWFKLQPLNVFALLVIQSFYFILFYILYTSSWYFVTLENLHLYCNSSSSTFTLISKFTNYIWNKYDVTCVIWIVFFVSHYEEGQWLVLPLDFWTQSPYFVWRVNYDKYKYPHCSYLCCKKRRIIFICISI